MNARLSRPVTLLATSLLGAALLTACGIAPKQPAEPAARAAADPAKARPDAPGSAARASVPHAMLVPGDLPAPPTPPLRLQPYDGLDGLLPNPPPDLIRVANAVPRVEPLRKGSPNVPYAWRGQVYQPLTRDEPVRERGLASWYGRKFHGQRTASGEIYNMYAMTAAHPTLPIPSYARVRNRSNGREVIVRVNDRGPFKTGRIIDLSYTAALKLGFGGGLGPVEVERLTHEAIRTGSWRRDSLFGNEPPSAGFDGSALAALATLDLPDDLASWLAPVGLADSGSDMGSDMGSDTGRGGDGSAAAAAPSVDGADPARSAFSAFDAAPLWAQQPARATLRLPESTEPAKTAAARGWWLRFGAPASADAAARHQRDLAEQADWLAPLLTPLRHGGQVTVQAGPFPSRDEALAAAEQWRAEQAPVAVTAPPPTAPHVGHKRAAKAAGKPPAASATALELIQRT